MKKSTFVNCGSHDYAQLSIVIDFRSFTRLQLFDCQHLQFRFPSTFDFWKNEFLSDKCKLISLCKFDVETNGNERNFYKYTLHLEYLRICKSKISCSNWIEFLAREARYRNHFFQCVVFSENRYFLIVFILNAWFL